MHYIDRHMRSDRDAIKEISSFFFSSRRRHTRSKRDWSSDVCSSDLITGAGVAGAEPHRSARDKTLRSLVAARGAIRSEERRVGKEWRSRWPRAPIRRTAKRESGRV